MGKWIFNIAIVCFFGLIGAATWPLANKAIDSAAADVDLSKAMVQVELNGTYLVVHTDRPIVKSCGDTVLIAFISNDQVSGSLEPVLIPNKKAEAFVDSQTFFFSLLKMAPFIGDGVWTVEIFVDNDCSNWGKSIALDPAVLIIGDPV